MRRGPVRPAAFGAQSISYPHKPRKVWQYDLFATNTGSMALSHTQTPQGAPPATPAAETRTIQPCPDAWHGEVGGRRELPQFGTGESLFD
jgi:hypothetical protein